jgi:sugar/nucleoside kinase (ribokinase family)
MMSNCPRGAVTDVVMACFGSLLPRFTATPLGAKNGNKCDSKVQLSAGGSAFNTALVAAVNGVPAAAISTQRPGLFARLCRKLAKAAGIRPVLHVSRRVRAGITLATPNGQPGQIDLWVSRPSVVTKEWPTEEIREVLATVRVVIQGPIRLTRTARDWLDLLPALAPDAYRMLIPHPSLIESGDFGSIARKFNGVFMTYAESCELPGSENEIVKNACRLAFLTKYQVDFAITASGSPGILYCADEEANGRWPYRVIQPPRVSVISDDTVGDTFTSAWCYGRRIVGLSVDAALDYAVDAAADIVTQAHPKRPKPYRPPTAPPAP